MKRQLAILALFAALIYGAAAYTRPESAPGAYIHAAIDPAVSKAVKSFQRLPYVRLLNWENEYQPRPTLKRLEVVPATDTPYTPEELSEIYPSH